MARGASFDTDRPVEQRPVAGVALRLVTALLLAIMFALVKLVSSRGSRFKLTPDMRLAYSFDDREKLDRMAAARARLEQLRGLVAR